MPTVPVYNMTGEKVRQLQLSDSVFGVPVKPHLIASVVEALRANVRKSTAHTKTRGEVAGGGKKPWRQKGTGRARAGSIRSPLWRGGGVIFGPTTSRNYAKKVNRKVRHATLVMCLSDKVASGSLAVVSDAQFPEGKTSSAARFFRALRLATAQPFGERPSMFLLEEANALGRRAVKNIPTVMAVRSNELNTLNVLHHPYLVATASGIRELEVQLGGNSGKKKVTQ